MDIPGTGQFVIVTNTQDNPRVIPSRVQELLDLRLPPHEPVAVEDAWLSSPLLVEQMQLGHIVAKRSDTIPPRDQFKVDPKHGLSQKEEQFVYTVVRGEFTAQVKANIDLADHIDRTGRPRQGSQVTKKYLQERHQPMLEAIFDLEGRMKNRAEVKREVKKALKKIEAL